MKKLLTMLSLVFTLALFSATSFAATPAKTNQAVVNEKQITKLPTPIPAIVTEDTFIVTNHDDAHKILTFLKNNDEKGFNTFFDSLLKADKAGAIQKGALINVVAHDAYYAQFSVPEIKEPLWVLQVFLADPNAVTAPATNNNNKTNTKTNTKTKK